MSTAKVQQMWSRVTPTLHENIIPKMGAGQRPERHAVLMSVSAHRDIRGVLTCKIRGCVVPIFAGLTDGNCKAVNGKGEADSISEIRYREGRRGRQGCPSRGKGVRRYKKVGALMSVRRLPLVLLDSW